MASYKELSSELQTKTELIKNTPKLPSTKAIIRGLALRCQTIKAQMKVMEEGIGISTQGGGNYNSQFHAADDPLLNTTDIKNKVHTQLKK